LQAPLDPAIAASGEGAPYDARVANPPATRLSRLEDRYAVAALLIVFCIIATAVGGDHRVGQVIFVVIESVTLIVIMHASRVTPRTIRIVSVVVALAVVGAVFSILSDSASLGAGIVGALLALAGPIVIVRRVRNHARIDLNTVAASLCVYLLAGMFFAYLFRILHVVDDPFFVQFVHRPGRAPAADYVYFSFTTLTTLGYGDLTARTELGRMLAVSEALLGQLYLVSVVALFVGNLGSDRRRPVASGDEDA